MPGQPPTEQVLNDAFRYALALVHDRSLAEDIVQDACVSLHRIQGGWTHGAIFRAVRHRFIDRLRREGRRQGSAVPELNGRHDARQHDIICDRASTAESFHELSAAMSQLRSAEREVLYLSIVQQYSASQIAKLTHQPRSSVLSLMQRSREKLAAMLKSVQSEVQL